MVAATAPKVYGGPQGEVIMERVAKSGQRLFYRLEVIQQPERARACGSGPKSSADRRPVDPPPVVELRVFTGGADWQTSRDITFHYNANFFLFATLEHARVIAHGRVQTPAANTPPVLTGMPVSGMAYLDRPQEAGYFLFPDLSVRHEGRYRLSFNLFEQTKEDKDMDLNPSESKKQCEMDETFDWRMEVKSNEFMVFSAKKFPGLTESTALSRTVAEQGCRVRIRRDVRMRRRDGKGVNGDYEEEGEEFARQRRTRTPEVERMRARSMSSESVQRTPYSTEARRTSGVPPFAAAPPASSHLAFGGQQAHYPPQAYPREQQAQPSSVPPSPSYPPPQAGPAPPYAIQPATYHQERPPSQHMAPEPSPQRESFSHPYQRPREDSYGRSYPPPPPSRESMQEPPNTFPPLVAPSEPGGRVTLPPLSALVDGKAADNKLGSDRSLPPISPTSGRIPSIASQSFPYPSAASLGKRSFDQFNPSSAQQQFKNGTRQPEESYEERERYYARADGRAMRVAQFPDGSY